MKTFYFYQLKDDYLQLVETIECERPTKEHADLVKEKYGEFTGYIYHGWEQVNANIVGRVCEKELSPLRKIRTYIMKEKKL